MKFTKKEQSELLAIVSDVAAQGALIEMGATVEKEKLDDKINQLFRLLHAGEIINA